MNKKTLLYIGIAVLAIVCLVVFLAIRYVDFSRDFLLDGIQDARDNKYLPNVNLMPNPRSNQPISWSISFWMYVDDWDYRYNEDKYVIRWDNSEMWLVRESNILRIAVPLHNDSIDTLDIPGIDTQKWNHVCVVLENRYLDCWINGELRRSIHLSNVPRVKVNTALYITPYGGFRGKISSVKMYNRPLKQYSYIYANTISTLYRSGHKY